MNNEQVNGANNAPTSTPPPPPAPTPLSTPPTPAPPSEQKPHFAAAQISPQVTVGQVEEPTEAVSGASVLMDAPAMGMPDRSNLQSMYPQMEESREPTVDTPSQYTPVQATDKASSSFYDISTLFFGVASSTSYVLVYYLVKNLWLTAAISIGLALAAILFAIKNYRHTDKTTPLSVVGMSAATITIANVLAIVVSYMTLKSGLGL